MSSSIKGSVKVSTNESAFVRKMESQQSKKTIRKIYLFQMYMVLRWLNRKKLLHICQHSYYVFRRSWVALEISYPTVLCAFIQPPGKYSEHSESPNHSTLYNLSCWGSNTPHYQLSITAHSIYSQLHSTSGDHLLQPRPEDASCCHDKEHNTM
jgi:hypothetical protein